jgi:hypothetical protein
MSKKIQYIVVEKFALDLVWTHQTVNRSRWGFHHAVPLELGFFKAARPLYAMGI